MKRPVIIYLIIILLLYLGTNSYWGVYKIWSSEIEIDPFSLIFGTISLFSAISLFYEKKWSKYLIYLISLFIAGTWLLAIWVVIENGWPYTTIMESIISLIPGFLLLTICIFVPVAVHQYFDKNNKKIIK